MRHAARQHVHRSACFGERPRTLLADSGVSTAKYKHRGTVPPPSPSVLFTPNKREAQPTYAVENGGAYYTSRIVVIALAVKANIFAYSSLSHSLGGRDAILVCIQRPSHVSLISSPRGCCPNKYQDHVSMLLSNKVRYFNDTRTNTSATESVSLRCGKERQKG